MNRQGIRFIRRLLQTLVGISALISCALTSAQAEDVLRLYRPDADANRQSHGEMVITEAMRRTQPQWGAYRVERYVETMVRERLMEEMLKGDVINTAVVASQPEWETRLVPIWIPVDMGLASLRIGLIRRDAQTRMSSVRSEADLRTLRIGVGQGWSSRRVFEANGYSVETAANQGALTQMLLANRFDYFPRSINEAFEEHGALHAANPALAIETDLLLQFPLPTYIFVSPNTPRLAQRLSAGLESMVRDGTLLKMVNRFHADTLERGKLCARRVIAVPNPLLSERHPLQRRELWFDPHAKGGYCETRALAKAAASK